MMVLRQEGHETRGVYRGSDVLKSISEFEPDAILLDINLPDADGYQLARAIKDSRGKPPLLIGISGVYMKGSDKVLAELVGFDHYLTKPYEPSDVLTLLAPLRTQEPQ
jgi:DNA-binding response OmpR family regulator